MATINKIIGEVWELVKSGPTILPYTISSPNVVIYSAKSASLPDEDLKGFGINKNKPYSVNLSVGENLYLKSSQPETIIAINEGGGLSTNSYLETSDGSVPADIKKISGIISTGNSTTELLLADEVFTGAWEEITDCAIIKVNITSDQDSAVLGLCFQQSPDTVIIFDEPYNLDGDDHKLFTPNPVAKYFRIKYTNGGTDQGLFSLQTIYSSVYTKPSSHRLGDTVNSNDDTELVKSVLSYLNENDQLYNNVGIQNPLPVDGDFAYSKDIWLNESDIGDFSGSVIDLFNNLHSVIINNTANNPKELLIHFNKTIISSVVGLGSFSGNFSNVEIQIGNSGGVFLTVVNESAIATKYTSRTFLIPATAGFNAVKFIFHTTDTITLSNCVIAKTRAVVSRLQAVSESSGLVEDIKSFSGALNVTDGLVNKLFVNRYFEQDTAVVSTITTAITSQDKVINLTSAVGFAANDRISIRSDGPGSTQEITLEVVSISVNALNIDRPIDKSYPISGTTIRKVLNNMAVNGSVTPQSFKIIPPPSGDKSIFQITRFLISMSHTGVPDDGKFGGIVALTNGVCFRAFVNGAYQSATHWDTNADLKSDMYDVIYSDKAPAGTYGTNGRWTITNAAAIFEMNGANGDFLEVLIQDNLTTLSTFEIKAQGRIFGV